MILLMTSEPDGQGQIFIDDMTKKISLAKKNFPKQELWIDGDINIERANKLQKLGVDKFVMGRELFTSQETKTEPI